LQCRLTLQQTDTFYTATSFSSIHAWDNEVLIHSQSPYHPPRWSNQHWVIPTRIVTPCSHMGMFNDCDPRKKCIKKFLGTGKKMFFYSIPRQKHQKAYNN